MGNTLRDAASLSAMLESSDHGSSSLDSVMTSSNSPCTGLGDSRYLFASQYSPLQGSSFPLSAASSGQQLAIPTSSSTAQMPEWPYLRDERWVFEPSKGTSSALVTTNLSSDVGVPSESSLNPLGHGRALLQRFNSAPGNLLECLADFDTEDVVTPPVSDPFGDREDGLLTWADNLVPIVKRGPQQMDTEIQGDASSSLDGGNEQFLESQTGFERRISTISTSTQSFGEVEPRSLTHQLDGLVGGYGAIPVIQDSMGESTRPTPSFNQMAASFLSQAESMTGTSEEKYGGAYSTMSSAYRVPGQQLSYQLGNELPGAASGSGLWNCPTTPVVPGLIQHFSLPANPRANRGYATHPRSIAERVRRGKISERMKKLQDLVPNIERQSNTADMLDEVVEYVRQLQLQVQELSNTVVQLQTGRLQLHPD